MMSAKIAIFGSGTLLGVILLVLVLLVGATLFKNLRLRRFKFCQD